jgi:hypothetical protein
MEQEKPLGQVTPPNFVEVKHVETPNGVVVQEFRQIKLFKHKTRRPQGGET